MENIQNFSSFALPEPLLERLTKTGFLNPTPIQASAIPAILEGKDILGLAPTGTGKTGAFGIPAIAGLSVQKDKQVLVLAPTRELANQIFVFMTQLGQSLKMKGALLVGGESFRKQYTDWNMGVDFMVATPGRLLDHTNQGLDLAHVGILVLDEVDHMLDMGFAEAVEAIVKQVPEERQTLFFSATMPPQIQGLSQRYLKDPVRIAVAKTPENAPKIREEKLKISVHDKTPTVVNIIQESPDQKILIFARTQLGSERLRNNLEAAGVETAYLHGGRTQFERKRALEAFRNGRVRVMVATDVAARGIDVPDIGIVINFDPPATREDYLHRIGRTGRCGKEGVAITLVADLRPSARREPQRRGFERPHFRQLPPEHFEPRRPNRLGFQGSRPQDLRPPKPMFAKPTPAPKPVAAKPAPVVKPPAVAKPVEMAKPVTVELPVVAVEKPKSQPRPVEVAPQIIVDKPAPIESAAPAAPPVSPEVRTSFERPAALFTPKPAAVVNPPAPEGQKPKTSDAFTKPYSRPKNLPQRPFSDARPEDRAPRNFDRPARPFDRERRNFDREPRKFDREPRKFDREPRPFDREPRRFDGESQESRAHRNFDREPRSNHSGSVRYFRPGQVMTSTRRVDVAIRQTPKFDPASVVRQKKNLVRRKPIQAAE